MKESYSQLAKYHKKQRPFWRAGFYLANQSNLKSFQKAEKVWKKE